MGVLVTVKVDGSPRQGVNVELYRTMGQPYDVTNYVFVASEVSNSYGVAVFGLQSPDGPYAAGVSWNGSMHYTGLTVSYGSGNAAFNLSSAAPTPPVIPRVKTGSIAGVGGYENVFPPFIVHWLWRLRERWIRPEVHRRLHPLI